MPYSCHSVKFLLLGLFVFFSIAELKAQKEYNWWYFGEPANSLNFNSSPPAVGVSAAINVFEKSSGICDKDGNLVLYTNGEKVWNRYQSKMQNGDLHGSNHSFRNSYVFLMPGQDSVYVIVVVPTYFPIPDTSTSLSYSLVDLRRWGGLGEVVQRNIPISRNVYEGMAVCQHANGRDFWIIAPTDRSNIISSYLFTPQGLDTSQKIIASTEGGSDYYKSNNIKISYDGRYLAQFGSGYTFLYKFDNNTGMLSNKLAVTAGGGYGSSVAIYEFSANSRFLYTIESGDKLVQYDMLNWNSDSISRSRFVINPPPVDHSWADIALGPDGRLYVSPYTTLLEPQQSTLSVIEFPWRKGSDCGFAYRSIQLQQSSRFWFFPNIIYSSPFYGLGPDTALCEGDSLLLIAGAHRGWYQWNTGDATDSLWVKKNGIYSVMAIIDDDTFADTVNVWFETPRANLGPDSLFCDSINYVLNAGGPAATYLWSTGDTTSDIDIKQPGVYFISLKNEQACEALDTVKISVAPSPTIYIGNDSTFCGTVDHTLIPQSNAKFHLWNTGDTTRELYINNDGTYSLLVKSEEMCENADTVVINKLEYPYGLPYSDTIVCGDALILDAGNPGMQYLWNTGAQTRTISANTNGVYLVEINNGHCKISSSITITLLPPEVCEPYIHIPNSFTPNGDGLNDVFELTANKVNNIQFNIYDRWGGLIHSGPSWDGTKNSTPLPGGVYMYTLSYTYADGIYFRIKHTSGLVHLIR